MRLLCSSTLVLEAVVVLLAIAPMIVLTDLPAGWVVTGGVALAVVAVLVAGSLRRPGAYTAGFVVQALVLASGFLLPAMFVVGVVFSVLWVVSWVLGRRMEADKVRWAAEAAAGVIRGPGGGTGTSTGTSTGAGTGGGAGTD